MIFDKQNTFCDHTAITAAGTNIIGDFIDLYGGKSTYPNVAAPQGPNGPIGGPLAAHLGRYTEVEVQAMIVDGPAAGGTSVQLQLVKADDASGTNAVVLKETAVIATAALVAGYVFRLTGDVGVGVNADGTTTGRYLGLRAVVVGSFTSGATDGKISAGIVWNTQSVHF